MPARTIAIGDIHGCSTALRAIISAIEPQPNDTVVLLGDYVDRGPDSRGAIELVLELEQRCRVVPLLGNHEVMLLDAVANPVVVNPWLECGGDTTLASYGGRLKNIPEGHLEFMRRCKRFYENSTHFFVHANYAADIPLDEQPDYLLFWEHLHFRIPRQHKNGKRAIVGHTSQKGGVVLDLGHVVCIDTFCHGGGWLTALDTGSGQLWQADLSGRMRSATKGENHESHESNE
jgi:serine/threonine protein phosphatase 1